MPASSSALASFSGVCPPNCTMTPCSVPFACSLSQDFEHVLGGQRLEIEPVGGVVVGRDGLRVAVDHDGLVARLAQREAGVAAAIVELDALADAVRPAAEDDDLLARPWAAPRRPALPAKGARIGRVHVGGGRGELGRAGVDALVDRAHAERAAARVTFASRQPGEHRRGARPKSPSPSAARKAPGVVGRPMRRTFSSIVDDAARSARGTRGRSCRPRGSRSSVEAEPHRLRHLAAAGRASACRARRGWRSCRRPGRAPRSRSRRGRSARSPASAAPSAAISWKVRPIAMASPTDFIAWSASCSAPGNFSKAKRGILVTT